MDKNADLMPNLYRQPIGQLGRIFLGSALSPETVNRAVRYQALQLIAHEIGVYRDDQGNQIPSSARLKPVAEVEQAIATKAKREWQDKVNEAQKIIGLNTSIQLPEEIPPFNAILNSAVTGYAMDRSLCDYLLLLQSGVRAHAILEGKVDFFEPKMFEGDADCLQRVHAVVIRAMQAVKTYTAVPADLEALGSEAILLATQNLQYKGIDVVQELEDHIRA